MDGVLTMPHSPLPGDGGLYSGFLASNAKDGVRHIRGMFGIPVYAQHGITMDSEQTPILPTGLALDDLRPSVLLAGQLIGKGIAPEKVVFAFCRIGESEGELLEARDYITDAGYSYLESFKDFVRP